MVFVKKFIVIVKSIKKIHNITKFVRLKVLADNCAQSNLWELKAAFLCKRGLIPGKITIRTADNNSYQHPFQRFNISSISTLLSVKSLQKR